MIESAVTDLPDPLSADDAEDLSVRHGEVDPLEHAHRAGQGIEPHAEILDLKQRRFGALRRRGGRAGAGPAPIPGGN